MQYRMEAVAEPQYDEGIAGDIAAEQEVMRKAEVEHIVEAGIDPTKIKWLKWEVTGHEEAVWTVECSKKTRDALEAAGWLFTQSSAEDEPMREQNENTEMVVKLEKGVPLPQKSTSPWPFAEMQVGDSFVGNSKALRATAQKHKRSGWGFQRQKLGPDEWRIWRVG